MVVADLVRTLSSPRWAGLHFALIGAVLLALQPSPGAPLASGPIELDWATASDEDLLHREALRRGLDRDDEVIRRRLVQNMRFVAPAESREGEADEAALYREALALGLDRSDPVVRRRLVERARESLIAQARIVPPDDALLRAHLVANRERFTQPERRRIEQLYFARAEAARDALAELAEPAGEADSRATLEATGEMANALPIARELPSLSQRELAARFGVDFSRGVFQLDSDRWSGPYESSYGAHLVRVLERVPERVAALSEVRRALTSHWINEQRAHSLRAALDGLRRAEAAEAGRRTS